MPRMDNQEQLRGLIKLLLIADGKLGKTFYAAMAAKYGFNVLYLDGDVGAETIGSMGRPGPDGKPALTREELSRIYLLDVADTIMGGIRDTHMVEFMNEFVSSMVTRWDDTDQRLATRRDIDKEVWEIRPSLMGRNDILVIDSWTAYTESIMLWCGRANGVDIANATTEAMRPVYQGGALKATEMLQVLRSIRCHVILIAHPDEYSHMTRPEGRKQRDIKEADMTVDWTKLIPKSTSKPQGLVVSKYLTDIAWMELSPAGNERRLNFKPRNDRVSGGHFHDVKSVDEYNFLALVKQVGGQIPTGEGPDRWLKIIPPAESGAEPAAPADSPVLDGTTASSVQGKGIKSLFAKKPAAAQAE